MKQIQKNFIEAVALKERVFGMFWLENKYGLKQNCIMHNNMGNSCISSICRILNKDMVLNITGNFAFQ